MRTHLRKTNIDAVKRALYEYFCCRSCRKSGNSNIRTEAILDGNEGTDAGCFVASKFKENYIRKELNPFKNIFI